MFVGAESFFSVLHIDVNAPFLIAHDNVVKKMLFVTMYCAMSSEQTGSNCGASILVVFVQSVQHPSTKLLNLAH